MSFELILELNPHHNMFIMCVLTIYIYLFKTAETGY